MFLFSGAGSGNFRSNQCNEILVVTDSAWNLCRNSWEKKMGELMILEINNLTKTYGNLTALDSFTAKFTCGIYALLGVNGAGKSTLMGLLTDNVERENGEIRLDGTDILKLGSVYRKKIGYMPQRQALYEDFTPQEFLYYMAELKELKRKEAKEQIQELLTTVNLYEVRNKRIRTFSGGMKQRVMLAQTLLGNPEILILDEPTVGLDPRERNNFRNYLRKIAQGKIILYATHVVSDIENIADEAIIMQKGKIIKKGKISDLCKNAGKEMTLEEAFLHNINQDSCEGIVL